MIPDDRDTIVAIATARSGAQRGIVRLSGPDALAVVSQLIGPVETLGCRRVEDRRLGITLAGRPFEAPCDAYLWPGRQSYTRQPSAEIHTMGSMPVVEAIVEAACRAGARLAAPGEFTLRALLAGRIDLVQAEAVLGVIDAPGDAALRAALGQLAGGLSGPLSRVRDELISLLAELEAGLDFVDEEGIRFIEPDELVERLANAQSEVAAIAAQATTRGRRGVAPRVAIVGPPNAGKSSLLNALAERWSVTQDRSIVSPEPGATRDSVGVELSVDGFGFLLVDTAGRDGGVARSPLESAADEHSARDARGADLRIVCWPVDAESAADFTDGDLLVATKCDLKENERTTTLEWSPSGDVSPSPRQGERLGEGVSPGTRYPITGRKRGATPSPSPSPCRGGESMSPDGDAQGEPSFEPRRQHGAIFTSSQTGEGLEDLMSRIVAALDGGPENTGAGLVADTAERCRQLLADAAASLERAAGVAAGDHHELVALELRSALDHLGQVTGAVVTDDLLDRIFSKFCIGK